MIDESTREISSRLVVNYFKNLINLFYKILPLYESNEKTLPVYLANLRDELIGCSDVMAAVNYHPSLMSLISVSQFLIDNIYSPDCTQSVVKQKVFGAINICSRLASAYDTER